MRMALLLLLVLGPLPAFAETGMPALVISPGEEGGQTWSLSVQVLLLMTALTLLPSLVLATTSFTRIIIVLAIFRQALGASQTPPNQVLIGLALFLSFYVMYPVLTQAYDVAATPYMDGQVEMAEAIQLGSEPLRDFMLGQTREGDLEMFAGLSGATGYNSHDDIPLSVLIPSFLTSELKTAFQIGFLIFIPFLIIDLVVASVLMSMGMMMLSPMLISLPFKIMLFVLVDGWGLLVGTLVTSFAAA